MKPFLPPEVVEMMASREHRLHHWLWHEIRNSWLSYPEDVQQKIRDMDWEPPRPALDTRRRPILDNDAGEDFLYMHRQMLIQVSRILTRVNALSYPRVRVWVTLPCPTDSDFPVPPAWLDPTFDDEIGRRTSFETLQRLKSDIFFQKRLVNWQKLFKDPAFLRCISLGKLGSLIELSIHASMHMRWASPPAGFRPDPGPTEGHTIDPLWDDPRYDFLGDTYASHVNPVFWSLHGWIDDRIEDWKLANGIYGNDFWKGTWVGKMPEEHTFDSNSKTMSQRGAMPGPEITASAASDGSLVIRNGPAADSVQALKEPRHFGSSISYLEELVSVIGRCGIFHEGYRHVLTSTFV